MDFVAKYSLLKSFICIIFLLHPFNTRDCYYFTSNVSLVWHIKVMFVKKYNVVLQSWKHKGTTFAHELFLWLSHTCLGQYCQKNVAKGGATEKTYKGGMVN